METNFDKVCLIRAPAKAILCGEHAVVYGQDAIAIAIGLYCEGLLTKRNKLKDNSSLTISLDIQTKEINISAEMMELFDDQFKKQHSIRQFIHFDRIVQEKMEQKSNKSLNSRCLHFKLGLYLASIKVDWKNWIKQSPYDYHLIISSTIPLGKCLGSSAAFNTVLSTAFLAIFQPALANQNQQISCKLRDSINDISVIFESVEHGNPSGIDNFVSVHGGMILFNKLKQPKFKRLDLAAKKFKEKFDVAIADSKIPKNTKVAVEMVRKRCQTHQQDQQKIKQIGKISTQMLNILQKDQIIAENLLSLINKNHEMLKQFDLSHPQLERIRNKGEELGWSGKITGSGMGGCLLLLAESNKGKENQEIRLAKLDEKGLNIQFYQAS